MTPERLAQIRERANTTVDGWPLYVTAPTTGAVDCRELLAYVDELEGEREPHAPVTDVVQLVIPRGHMLDGINRVLKALGVAMAGPLPLDGEPIPTYVLQPIDTDVPKEQS